MSDPIGAYDRQAASLAARYETTSAEAVHAALLAYLPAGPSRIALDIGAGSGRDAAWLASKGFEVVAAEPSKGMRAEGQRLHRDTPIRWLDDRLPDLAAVHRLGLSFDLILLTAVWMHVPPPDRTRAFRKVVTLLKPGGTIWISLRDGPPEPDRPMWSAPVGEIEALCAAHGLAILKTETTQDQLGRGSVRWTSMCLRLPDDGAGALPLLRGIILNDNKSATYKLALLRAVARIADAAPALALQRPDEDEVDIPLGLVALNWVRQYLPLVAANLPQMPNNIGVERLSFAKDGFQALLNAKVVGQDLRIGATFGPERASAVRAALDEARKTVVKMPAHFTRFPGSTKPVFDANPGRTPKAGTSLAIDAAYLRQFGTLSVPGHLWRTLQRLSAWVEPVLVSEWSRLVRAYGERAGRLVQVGEVERALVWADPIRDTSLARSVAMRLIEKGGSLSCIWTGQDLSRRQGHLDIDHCMPWSAWPSGDLWNLLPSTRRVNQHLKRDRLPSAATLAEARPRIIDWWAQAWLSDTALSDRFSRECSAALPIEDAAKPADVFDGLEWRRLRLQQDQQVPEW